MFHSCDYKIQPDNKSQKMAQCYSGRLETMTAPDKMVILFLQHMNTESKKYVCLFFFYNDD